MKKLNKEIFVERSLKTHGDKYDYSFVEYVDIYTKVKIYCKKCDVYFYQTPKSHMKKNGCSICGGSNKLTIENFIKKSIEIHGDKYDYSMVIYVNSAKKVKIICKKHNHIFEQSPNAHLKGCGCLICGGTNKLNNDLFIEKSIKLHGDRYDYSLVEYINNSIKVKIICKEHNYIFEQKPNDHLFGHGCKLCWKKRNRLNSIKRIQENLKNDYQIMPNFNKNACKLFDEISLKENVHILHAMNGGEFNIKELGYWLDGYDKENNTVYEFDEKHHKYQTEKDKIRQQEIENFLKCKFIRIKG